MKSHIEKILTYVDSHPGMPTATLYTVASGLIVLEISAFFHPLSVGQFWLAAVYTISVLMVLMLGWLYDRLISVLNDEPDYLVDALGLNSWVVIYDIDGRMQRGMVEMDRASAADWTIRSPTAAGITKLRGPAKGRMVWKAQLTKEALARLR